MNWTAVTLQSLITGMLNTSFERLLREEQKVYSQYVSQHILKKERRT